jgi:four helix bundle protein
MNYQEYTTLNVWQESKQLVVDVYFITTKFPATEIYGLTSQIRRCAVSIPSNIAEGCGRNHVKDSMQFFYISRGSLYELETQLYISQELNYIDNEELTKILNQLVVCKKLLNGFINYFKTKL